MVKLLISSLKDLKDNIRQYILIGLISLFMTSFIFVPLISFIFQRMILLYNSGIVLNEDIFKIFMDKDNLFSLLLILILAITFLFMEMSIYAIVSQKKMFKKEISITEAFLTALSKLPRLLTIELIYFLVLFIFVLPLVELPVDTNISRSVEIPVFIENRIAENPFYTIIYFCSLIIMIYGLYRLIFTLHGVLLRKEKMSLAMKHSLMLTKISPTSTFLKLVFINVFYSSIGFGFLFLISLLNKNFDIYLPQFIERYLISFSSIFLYLHTMLLTPFNMIFLTRLYYNLSERLDLPTEDKLKLYAIPFLKKLENKIYLGIKQKKISFLIFILITIAFSLYTSFTNQNQFLNQSRNITVIAHRSGYKDYPENSISAISNAIDKNIEIIEIDVQLTKDNVPVVHHDYSLLRMTGVNKNIKDVSFQALQNFTIKGYDETYIPSLKEVLDYVDKQAFVLIDLKGMYNNEVLIDNIMKDVLASDMSDFVYIQSFNTDILSYTKSNYPQIKVGQVMYFFWGRLSNLDVDFYTVHHSMLNRDLMKEILKLDKKVWVWTIETQKELDLVLNYNIDGIITSDFEMVQEKLGIKEESEIEIPD
jgi:glycerophosphoryl diester phosphodiesterase